MSHFVRMKNLAASIEEIIAMTKSCKIEELNKYLLSMKFDSYYDDNLLYPDIGPCKLLEQGSTGGWARCSMIIE